LLLYLEPMTDSSFFGIVNPVIQAGRCRRVAPKAASLDEAPVGSRLAARFALGFIARGSALGARRISFTKSPNSCPSFELASARKGHHE
jgi:hypothetical protein